WPRADKSHKSAVGAACDSIREVIRDLGVSDIKTNRQIRDLESRQETAESKIKETENRIDHIVAYTMSDSMFSNLKKLSTGRFGRFRTGSGLRRELRHLRDIGYVTVKGSIGNLPKEGDNLSDFVTIKPIGKEFVDFREALKEDDRDD